MDYRAADDVVWKITYRDNSDVAQVTLLAMHSAFGIGDDIRGQNWNMIINIITNAR
jgi:hypothetical protein